MSCEKTSSASLLRQMVSNIWNLSSVNDGPDCEEYVPPKVQYCEKSTSTEDCENSDCSEDSEHVFTENGAVSFGTTEDPRLDLFFKTVRGMTDEYLEVLLEKSWALSPRDTLRTMFYVRDCRGGKGERKIFWSFMWWLWRNHRTYFEKNLPCIPFYGSFKDLKQIMQTGLSKSSENGWALESSFEKSVISYWCDVIAKDVVELNHDRGITLAAKWIPIQDGRFCREMGLSHKFFRKTVRLLREKLDLVECKMSAGEWDKILFERVCSLSMKKYSSAFRKHCEERFSEYLKSVQRGETKMNVGQLYPSDIASQFLNSSTSCDEETLNVAWEQLLKKTRDSLSRLSYTGETPKRFLCVVDTSGSMSGQPLNVAVGLGLFLSELYPDSRFYRKFITFSSKPELQEAQGSTLKERIESLGKANWEMNTNLQRVFDVVLQKSTPEDHPDVLIILSDMQFDAACVGVGVGVGGYGSWDTDPDSYNTNLSVIESRYREAGIERPRLIFWNLRANTIDFAATTEISDCGLVSGYSTSLMDSILQDGDISPMTLFRNTIDAKRYDMVYTENSLSETSSNEQ